MTPLTPERWQQIDQLFAEALERAPSERLAWIDAASRDDPDLRQAVLELLESAGQAEVALGESVSSYADTIVAEMQAELAREDAAELPLGGRIGPYRLLREVGRGGMGTVYVAERADAQFEKRVALKLVKRGMDTDEVLRRFYYERQILAGLEHPYIARLYDGGAAEHGRPYLVMEYIEGQPITRSCDERRLPIEARLRLFAGVCEAVQFAHRNLVVHRDIKPSNILVDADGRPKLLDFGIAKLLDPRSPGTHPRTRTELRLLTPEYAPPEQREGGPITTAADVYSLGLVLHELLTGRRPGATGVERPSTALSRQAAAATEEAARLRGTTPDRLRRRLRGDLDVILLRALAEDPERRYPSAEQLLADIERHLDGLPVTARGDSLSYRAQKFVRRHRVTVGAGSLVLVSLLGGLGAALWQADRAAWERDEARQARERAEQVSEFVLGLFEAADPFGDDGGDTLRVHSLVDRGAERVRRELGHQPRLQAQILTTLGRVYTNLGLYAPAQAMFDEAFAVAPTGASRERAEAISAAAEIAYRRGDHAVVDSLHATVLSLYETEGWQPDATYANSLTQRGAALETLGREVEARSLHERALRLLDELYPERGKQHAGVLNNLAVHHAGLGEYARADPLMREVLEIDRRLYGPRHPRIAGGLNNLASALQYQGRYGEAEAMYHEAVSIAREALGADHSQVGQFRENLATLLADLGRNDEAEPHYREALRIATAAFGAGAPRVALLKRNLALNRHALGDYAEAERLLRSAAEVLAAEFGADHVYTALAEASLGRTLTASGRPDQALPVLRGSLAKMEQGLPDGHWRIHAVRSEIGAAVAARGDHAAAEPLLLESYSALLEQKGAGDYSTVDARRHLHRFYVGRGQSQRAAAYREPA